MATKTKTAKKTKKTTGQGRAINALQRAVGGKWVYDKKTRGAYNPETGERISRRQLDVNYGILKDQGFKGYEQKSKIRKTQNMTGFRPVKGHKMWIRKRFDSRDEMVAFLKSGAGTDYIFRVFIFGEPQKERWKSGRMTIDAGSGDIGLFADQIAPEGAESLGNEYGKDPEQFEHRFKADKIKYYELVATKRNE